MCGIAGIIHRDASVVQENELLALGEAFQHRGPDESGHIILGRAGLMAHRFALEDIAGGRQPSSYRHITIVWNGEIFNWRELAQKYDLPGQKGDTALLPRLFEKIGPAMLPELNGQFALAIWDAKNERLTLARDQAGILPLHYAARATEFIFASEQRTLRGFGSLPNTPDEQAVSHFFRMGFFAAPQTPFAAIRQLEPGCALVVDGNKTSHIRFYKPALTQDFDGNLQDAARELAHLMDRAVKRRLSAESTQGLFLSGGVDSALIAATLKQQNVHQPIFTVGFSGDGPLAGYHFQQGFEKSSEVFNEFEAADAITGHLGLGSTRRVKVARRSLTEDFAEIVGWLDTPSMSISAPPLYFLTGEAAQSIRIALSGGGADELFAGYAHLDPARYKNAPSIIDRYLELVQVFSPDELRAIASPFADAAGDVRDALPQSVADAADIGPRALPFLLATERLGPLPQNILQKNDRIGMRMPLEMRYPFLDNEVVALAQRLPDELLCDENGGKPVVKAAAQILGLPEKIANRRKIRLQAPYATFLADPEVENFFRQIIENPPQFAQRPYDPTKCVEYLFGPGKAKVWRRPAKILLLATWNLWVKKSFQPISR